MNGRANTTCWDTVPYDAGNRIDCPLDQGGIGPLKFPLLSDLSHDIGKAYNCLITDGDDKGVHLRATYIINPEGELCCY